MYAEELKQKQISPLAGALITLGCVFGLLLCAFVVSFLQYWLRIVWPQFILYGGVIALVVLAMRRFFTEYIYLIERDRLAFGRRIGKREKELLQVPLREVLSIRPYNEEEYREKSKSKKRFRFTFLGKRTWSVIDCTSCIIIVTCTEEYTGHLRQCIHH